MAAFVFIGDDGEGPDLITLSGYTFILNGPPVLVSDPAAIAKFRGNRHFAEAAISPAKDATAKETAAADGADGADANAPAPSAQPKRRGRPPKDRT